MKHLKPVCPKPTKSALALSIALISSIPAAFANDGGLLEEVVVSARKVEENLQTTPVTVSAFTERAMENRGITSNVDIAMFTPNVVFDNSSTFAGADTFQAFIRGVGQGDFALNADPGVGLYVDGIYYARAPGSVVDFLDISRVEVLKGPQGTLFGRNSIGGAVHVVTNTPKDEFDFKGQVTLGEYDRTDISGVVNLPLNDNLLASVAFQSNNRDGFQERIPFASDNALGSASGVSESTNIPLDQLLISDFSGGGGARDLGAKDNESYRAKLLWLASDSVEVTFAIDSTTIRDAANATTLVEVDGNSGLGGLYNACIGAPTTVTDTLPCATSPFLQVSANADGSRPELQYTDQFITGDIDTTYATGANFSNIDNSGGSVTLDYSVNDAFQLKSITAYRELDSTFGLDIDGSPLAFDQTSFIMQTEQISQEFQFTGNVGERINYTAGLYYFEEDGYQADRVPIAGGLIQVSGDWDHDTEAYALFGELNIDLTDSVSFIVGGRYTDEERTLVLRQQNLNTDFAVGGRDLNLLPVPSDPSLLGPADPLSVSFSNTSFRTGFNWQATDDVFTYLTYSQGFKSGGFTTRLTDYFSEALVALADPSDPNVLRSLEYDPETADNIELGFKSEFGQRIRLNGAFFFNTYDDIQIVVQRGVSPSNENVAKAEIKGVELELEAYPTDSLAVTATLGYLDAEYTEFDPVPQALLVDRFGNRIDEGTSLANTPELTASLAFNLSINENWSVNLNGSYTDDVYNDVFNTAALKQDSVVMGNASVRFDSSDEKWNAILGVTNISDERYIVSGFEAGALPFTTASYNRPREWYLTMGYNF